MGVNVRASLAIYVFQEIGFRYIVFFIMNSCVLKDPFFLQGKYPFPATGILLIKESVFAGHCQDQPRLTVAPGPSAPAPPLAFTCSNP